MIYSLGSKRLKCLHENYYIAPTANVVGEVVLHEDASVWFNAVLRGDNEPITVGKRSNIQDGAVLHTDPGSPLVIGENVTVGHKAMLHGCRVGDNTLIGINAVILNGVTIGKNCIIGAQAMIPENKVIPDNSVVMGIPGKVVKQVSDYQVVHLKQSAQTYVNHSAVYRDQLSRLAEGDV